MKVSRNAYYCWQKNSCKVKNKEGMLKLKNHINSIYHKSRQTYGSPRICEQLKKEGVNYSRSYVARIMKDCGCRSILAKKFTTTTNSNHDYKVYHNILDRKFDIKELGKKWVSDITYIRCNHKWVYLTTMIDLADRKVVGWSLSKDMTSENTVIKAWNVARYNRNISNDLILHSDRGVQYASKAFTNIISKNKKAKQSMSRKGNCWDNAVAESFFKSIKYEMIYRQKFYNFSVLYNKIEEYINWYNYERLHSSLGYKTPFEVEMKLNKYINKAA